MSIHPILILRLKNRLRRTSFRVCHCCLPVLFLACLGSGQAAGVEAVAPLNITHYRVEGNTLLAPDTIERTLAAFTGKASRYADIQRAVEALEEEYRKAGYNAVQVVTPEQEITGGEVTLRVIEATIGKVNIKGNQFHDEDNIRAALPGLKQGRSPNARQLSENLRLANESPSRQMDLVLVMGAKDGVVDANLNVQDESPRKIYFSLDNTGNQYTGDYRTGIGLQYNNLFNRDQSATFSYITSPGHMGDVKQYAVSYRLPIYAWGDSVDIIAAYSDVNSGSTTTVAGPLSFSGKGRIYMANYNHYFPRRGEYSDSLSAGISHIAYMNNCGLGDFGSEGCGTAASADVTIHPLSLTYIGQWDNPSYLGKYSLALSQNLPGGSNGSNADFSASRPSPTGGKGAQADYTIGRGSGSLGLSLPQGWQARLAGNGQYTADALVPGEQFGLVGANAVRGFMEREIARDKGYVINAELYTPELSSKLNMNNGELRLLGFYDYGRAENHALAGESNARVSVASAGIGMRYSYLKNIAARLDWAYVLDGGGVRNSGDTRGSLAIVISY